MLVLTRLVTLSTRMNRTVTDSDTFCLHRGNHGSDEKLSRCVRIFTVSVLKIYRICNASYRFSATDSEF